MTDKEFCSALYRIADDLEELRIAAFNEKLEDFYDYENDTLFRLQSEIRQLAYVWDENYY